MFKYKYDLMAGDGLNWVCSLCSVFYRKIAIHQLDKVRQSKSLYPMTAYVNI